MIYVVMGSTGEYSDRSEWPLLAFRDEFKAQEKVKEIDEWLRANNAHMDMDTRLFQHAVTDALEKANPFDKNMSIDYTGTRYYIMSVEESE